MFRWRFGRDPVWNEFERLRRGMDDLFNALSVSGPVTAPPWGHARLFPLMNVTDLPTEYTVTAEIPGMKKEDLDIKIEGDTLTVKGERRPYDIGPGASYHRRERTSGTFQRSLTLPGRVDPEKVKASYKDGVLTISLGKEPSQIPKQINVSAE